LKKWNLIDQSLTPEGKAISLHEHDGTYSIRIDSAELMSTRRHASEDRIAELACADLKIKRHAHVLIGGLGMGFTLKSALSVLAPDAAVVVAEILPAIISWNRNTAFPLGSAAMADPRVTIRTQDVVEVIRAAPGTFDSIILDVDNGPAALTDSGNARLYSEAGLRLTRASLKPGACVGYWSAAPSPPFEKMLARAGFTVEVHRCRAHANTGSWHTLFLAKCA
jgi:spermidine synthase